MAPIYKEQKMTRTVWEALALGFPAKSKYLHHEWNETFFFNLFSAQKMWVIAWEINIMKISCAIPIGVVWIKYIMNRSTKCLIEMLRFSSGI